MGGAAGATALVDILLEGPIGLMGSYVANLFFRCQPIFPIAANVGTLHPPVC
jgi:hypothetical protein